MSDPAAPVEDLYAALGLDPGASADDIVRAYRRLVGDAAGQVAGGDAAVAYEILGDVARRRAHDATRRARERASSSEAVGSAAPTDSSRDAPDLELRLTFEQAALGTTATVHVVRQVRCHSCHGAGTAAADPSPCPACGGSGWITRKSSGGIAIRYDCSECGGTGEPPREPCSECGGTGEMGDERDVSVRVPPGVEEQSRIRFRAPGAAPHDDVHAIVRIAPHPYFSRRGQDIVVRLPITLAEAALGAVVTVPTLRGAVAIRIPPATSHGRTLRLAGRGIATTQSRGDLLATVEIDVPKELSEAQRRALEALAEATPSPRAHFEETPPAHE